MRRNVFGKFTPRLWVAILLVLANLTWVWAVVTRHDGLTHIYFLDVGHGDSILITTPERQAILIDGGPSASVVAQIDSRLPVWKRNLDLVVLTHPHADHVTGLIEVINRYHVDAFLHNPVDYDTHTISTLYSVISQKQVNLVEAKAGMTYDFNECRLDILYRGNLSQTLTDVNDTSIVSELTCGDFNALFVADISADIERELIAHSQLHNVEVLKVGHQGSRYSTSEAFLKVVQPETAVLTVGKNSFGHPHPETLAKLQQAGSHIYSTLADGTVEIVTDGTRYAVSSDN
ncbi:MAG: MBL fold metallo-hydrolase [Patescibacteria group bacterium]|nr:MBL fold metallo-hydrolase [Patescibacteria group bacterium]